ncbi:choline transporter-like protein 2 isoform X2 [Mizuhopecten yessoensis]|uniref:choline transporter-like protein 2 isoform X2 n=1 Tax=Mizuhopecten yessoensis TaxID=6573 RepID=UPI000B45B38F|nr:choline transporter-like protein 2 isoform X2 [Mizuhopecten yessoensis]
MGKRNGKVDHDESGHIATSEGKNYGTPLTYDPTFNGPIKNRSCTDIICCLLFLIFIGGFAGVSYLAFSNGDPYLLLYPEDSNGDLCGYGKNKGKDYLFFFDLVQCGRMGVGIFVSGCPTPQVCVSSCPDTNYAYITDAASSADLQYCKTGYDQSLSRLALVEGDQCPAYFLESSPLINRCVPQVLVDFLDVGGSLLSNVQSSSIASKNVTDSNNNAISIESLAENLDIFGIFLKAKEYGEKIVADIVSTWWMMLVILILSMIVSLIWIIALRFIAGIMVWITIFAFLGLFGFSTYWCFWTYANLEGNEEFSIHVVSIVLHWSKPDMFLAFGIISAVILLIMLIVLLFLCVRIRIAISLIKEGSRAIGKMMFTLIFPIFPFALQIAVLAYWLAVATYLASTGRSQDFSVNENSTEYWNQTANDWNYLKIVAETSSLFGESCTGNTNSTTSDFCTFLKNVEDNFVLYGQVYSLFMFFWLLNFVIAVGQMTLAGAFASYYWAFEKPRDIPTFPLAAALWRCFRYHLGSLAFGSLILAIVAMIRVLLEYVDAKLKGTENPVGKFLIKCLKCCFWCLEKCLKFLTKNAYIMVAIHGKNFCSSAKDAFMLIMRNIVRVAVVDKVTEFIMLLGKLVIVGATAAGAYFFFSGGIDFLKNYTPTLNFYVVPIVIVTIVSYVVASCFFSVYSMAVDTLFLCFLEDLERNDGSVEKPFYMSKDLMNILGKKNLVMKKGSQGENF